MGRKEKLLIKAQQNPKSLSFSDFETLLSLCDWTFKRQRGSHRLWYSPQGYRLSIQPKNSKAKDYQVKQFLETYGQET
jgi:predicted RNA binding protein YcfA (HicA-like mRNA interferase family)